MRPILPMVELIPPIEARAIETLKKRKKTCTPKHWKTRVQTF